MQSGVRILSDTRLASTQGKTCRKVSAGVLMPTTVQASVSNEKEPHALQCGPLEPQGAPLGSPQHGRGDASWEPCRPIDGIWLMWKSTGEKQCLPLPTAEGSHHKQLLLLCQSEICLPISTIHHPLQ